MISTPGQQSSVRGLEVGFDAIIAMGWPTEPPTVRGTGLRREHSPTGGRGAHAVGARLRRRVPTLPMSGRGLANVPLRRLGTLGPAPQRVRPASVPAPHAAIRDNG
jgi:hypothetical protein